MRLATLLNIFFIILSSLLSCSTQPHQPIKNTVEKFVIETKTVASDAGIVSAIYFRGYILCLGEDDKIRVFDTLFQPVDSLTKRLAKWKISALTPHHDTVWVTTNRWYYFLDSTFTIRKPAFIAFDYNYPKYSDSTYYVHACGAGEWGGKVFFFDRKKHKTYYYPVTDVQQVLKHNDEYLVTNYLAHMFGFTDFVSIKDPAKLYVDKRIDSMMCCNCTDSVEEAKPFDSSNVNTYTNEFLHQTLVTFKYDTSLYSICNSDSATIIFRHQQYRLVLVDTILKGRYKFRDASTNLFDDVTITATSGLLICIRGKRITFIEVIKPLAMKQ